MSDTLPTVLGFVELLVFFGFDYLYAKILNNMKQEHQELEECAPHDSPDLDTVHALDSLATRAVEVYQYGQERLAGTAPPDGAAPYHSLDEVPPETVSGNVAAVLNPLHATVVVCSVLAPVMVVLLMLFPRLVGWSRFHVPALMSYLVVVPGLAAAGLFATRATALSSMTDVTKSQWIGMMWFRLDFMFIFSGVALIGLGAWFVAICMLGVAAYLAHRVMKIEKRLGHIQRETQLVRGEVDVQRVFAPGSVESKRAMGEQEGYRALNVVP